MGDSSIATHTCKCDMNLLGSLMFPQNIMTRS